MTDRIDIRELEKAIARVGDLFVTKDISEQPELQAANRSDASHRQWHAFVGTAISKSRGALGVESIGRSARGERWSKVGSAKRAPVSAVAPTYASGAGGADLGPQSAGDAPFTARMRMHQSWWRASVLKLPHGHGPTASSQAHYGNMLDAAGGSAGKNFLTPEIFALAERRLAEGRGTIEPFRLRHNLLSSQPMCFNLFGPLVAHPERATRLIGALVGDDVTRVTNVAIEWAPEPAAEYLADRTAFDAMIEYERGDGSVVLLGIETKLTDTFSQKPYDGEQYRRWMRSSPSAFRAEAASDLAKPMHNQVWRNHLLAIAARDRRGSRYAAVRSAVVHHPLDADGARVVASYRQLLEAEDDTFVVWTLAEVIAAFAAAATADEMPWLDAFRMRYLALEQSEGAWKGRR